MVTCLCENDSPHILYHSKSIVDWGSMAKLGADQTGYTT